MWEVGGGKTLFSMMGVIIVSAVFKIRDLELKNQTKQMSRVQGAIKLYDVNIS
jgi:hypothetical protein